ncbi:MAG: hypothetical protein E6240_07765 [Clostridium butyricum]|uniref:DUF6932 family protein n=1 Tax=Clostridium sp. TaxID=1506 RepID=UPI00290AD8C4|nr:hypothetical protein [Clostridium sp.]MDU4589409.1 hypothetical protein [Clostridium sp.]MDU5102312.1 hypothetical protein [Clostridium butyricum]
MSIPQFNKRGLLNKGIYKCKSKEFIDRFCYGKDTIRSKYKEVLEQMFAFAIRYGVKSIIVAGSFVTDKENPNDIDCIIIFPNEKCIPMKTDELLSVEDCELDIMFASENNRELVYSLINMFAVNRFEFSVGMVEILLDEEEDKSTWDDYEQYNSVEKLLEAREAYICRQVIRGTAKKRLLVTICNIEEYLLWNYKIAPIVSSSGWTFAPYIYDSKQIESHIEHFTKWINAIYDIYETEISIFADGLGTYLIGKYFSNDELYRGAFFDKIILSKSLLTPNFNWERQLNSHRIKLVINLKDSANVINISEKMPKDIIKSDLYGQSYKLGFSNKYEKLIEYRYNYNVEMSSDHFKNDILPMFHISDALMENNDNELMNNFDLIIKRDTKVLDVIKKCNSLL